jgi:hypothetical protein
MLQVWRLQIDYVGSMMAMFFPAGEQYTILSNTEFHIEKNTIY